MHLVAGEVVTLGVVGANSIWVVQGLGSGPVVALVLKQVLDIILSELSVETQLHILDFLGDRGVVVVEGGLINEPLVQHTLEEEIEVRHESCVVSIFVLHEDGVKSEIDLGLLWVLRFGAREATEELHTSEESDAPDGGHDSNLQQMMRSKFELTPEYDLPILLKNPRWKAVILGVLTFFWYWSNHKLWVL